MNYRENGKDSRHLKRDRKERLRIINEEIGGYGNSLFSVVVDKGHVNGKEVHIITDNAIIMIYNQKTQIHVTDLIARPGQLTKHNRPIPEYVMKKARYYQKMGWNEI